MKKGKDDLVTSLLIWLGTGIALIALLLLLEIPSWINTLGMDDMPGLDYISRLDKSPERTKLDTLCDQLPKVVARVGRTEIHREEICGIAAPVTDMESEGFTEDEERFFHEAAWITANMKMREMVLRLEAQQQGTEESTATDLNILVPRARITPDAFDSYMGLPGFREHLQTEKLREREIYDRVQITEAEIEAFYEANKADFKLPYNRYTLRRILIRSPSKEQVEQAKLARWRFGEVGRILEMDKQANEQARAIVVTLRNKGADFAAIAAAHGDAPEREQGGLLGTFDGNKLPRQYNLRQRYVLSANGNRVTSPIATAEGYEIIIVDHVEPRRQMSLEEVRPEIVRRLKYEKGKTRELDWENELVRKWDGEIFVPKPDTMFWEKTSPGGELP